ncbi:transcriptional regulator [Rhizobium rhizosphaerae]|uniref:Transcriptional regulator n=1 Tax=Xaviernesmea rhizosphaerae TaxID=1672749 RepID=A0A1Q9APF5_9HYPH|nr:GlxA family transcriptional regulator [Xaviernesmea rhizosphaerae]OLP57308.1 transcriptional regulator [Xaviernesmea rhizosphaerae]
MSALPDRLDPRHAQTIGFLLLPNFALMSFASASEPLRAANLLAGTELYTVSLFSADGGTVASSSGLSMPCRSLAEGGEGCHTLFVCAGGGPQDWRAAEPAFPQLRRLARLGVRIGGISSGAFVLAACGLLEGRDFTLHWEHALLLKETFPHLSPRQARFVLDGDRITCAGGVAPLDMMHALISARMGADFARRVSDWYLHTGLAQPEAAQRSTAAERFGTHHPALLTVLEKMEATIEQPLDRQAMARLAGISPRHLDRLFARHMARGFLETYRSIRLAHGRRLVEQSPLSVAEIAFATGFSSAGHFSRAFSEAYGMTPHALRHEGQER